MSGAFHAHDDALGINRIHHARTLAQHHRAGIAGGHVLHAGAHVGSVGAQQRNGLALHVRSHQGAVGVVVFEERNQAGGHRDELLRADVDVLDLVARFQHEVAGLAGIGKIGHDAALLIELYVGLGHDPLIFFPGGQILAVSFEFGRLLFGGELTIGLLGILAADDVAHLSNRYRRDSGS